jgi:putative (di)nucleoside polyphosphate hydrolase
VGCALFDRRGLVWAGRRVDDAGGPLGGHWQMPQGGIDPGETPERAALRELKEEIGTDKARILGQIARWLHYDVPPDLADKVWRGRYRGQRQRWFALRFTGADADIDLGAHGEVEFAEWRWMGLDDLVDAVIPFKRKIYAEVAAEFRRFAAPAN